MNSNEIHSILSKALLSKEGAGHPFRGNQYTGGIQGNGSKVETAANWNKRRAARGLPKLKAFPLTPAQIKSAKQGRKAVTPETLAGYKSRLANAKLNRAKHGSGLTGKVSVHHGATDTTGGVRETPRYSLKQLLNVARTGKYGPAKGEKTSGLTGKVKSRANTTWETPEWADERMIPLRDSRPNDTFIRHVLNLDLPVLDSFPSTKVSDIKAGDYLIFPAADDVTRVRAVSHNRKTKQTSLLLDVYGQTGDFDYSEEIFASNTSKVTVMPASYEDEWFATGYRASIKSRQSKKAPRA